MKATFILLCFSFFICLHVTQAQAPGSAYDFNDPPEWQWAEQFGGSSPDNGYDIVTDNSGNIYLAGSFSGQITYGPNTYTSFGKKDAFVAKFTGDGIFLWLKQFHPSAPNKVVEAFAIDRDDAGRLYITGYYTGTMLFGTTTLPDMGPTNYFCARLDANGNAEMAIGPETPLQFESTGICIKVDQDYNMYFIVSDDLNMNSFTTQTDIFSYNENGGFRWVYSDLVPFCDMEISGNKIFYSGTMHEEGFIGPFFLDPPYLRDAFIAASDLDGNFLWATIPSHNSSTGYSQGYRLSVDANGDLYQCGYFRNDLVFNATILTGNSRSFIMKFDENGAYSWANDLLNYYLYNICSSTAMTVVTYASSMYAFSSITGDSLNMAYSDQYADRTYFNKATGKIIATGDFEQMIYLSSINMSLLPEWVAQFDGDSGIGYNVGVTSDLDGNIYCFNYTSNEVNYFGEPVEAGMFLARHDILGNISWMIQFMGAEQSYGTGCYVLADDAHDALYITGGFATPFIIPGVGTLTPGPEGSFYIICYTLEGQYQWHIQEDFPPVSYLCLAADHSGNVMISGTFSGMVTIGGQQLVSAGDEDIFIAKYNSDGQFQWARRGGGETVEYIGLISADEQDNIYFAGEFTSVDVTFGDQSVTMNDGDGNIFLAKLTPGGQVSWIKVKGGSETYDYNCWPTSIMTDPQGNSYIKGWHADSTHFDGFLLTNPFAVNKSYNYFIARIDPSGNTSWAHSINESALGYDYNQMDIDASGNVYLGAQVRDTVWFEDDYMYEAQNYPLSRDLFVAKYSPSGDLEWVKTVPTLTESAASAMVNCLTVLDDNTLVLGGYFKGNINFDYFELNGESNHGMIALLAVPESVYENPDLHAVSFTLSPNPADENVTIGFTCADINSFSLTLCDISGKPLLSERIKMTGRQETLDISGLPPGVYLVRIKNDMIDETKKLIVY